MHSVVFNPSGIRASVAAGATVLDAARAGGVDLDSVCGGRGLCGRCQVSPTDTRVLSSPGPTELSYRGRRPVAEGCRLGCQAVVLANAVIDVPAESQVHRPVVRKSINLDEVVIHPVVTLHYVELPEVVLGSEAAEVDLVAEALATDWGLPEVEFGVPVLARLHSAFAAGEGSVTVVVHGGRTVLDVRPGYSDGAWGVAVDVGSTTIAGYLLELASGEVAAASGRMNPQIRFGEDLMSRVSYVMMNPGGEAELTAAVRSAIDELVGELCGEAVWTGPRCTTWSWWAIRSCTIWCWAWTPPRWGRRRSRSPLPPRCGASPLRSGSGCRARPCTSVPASPGMWGRTRLRRL